jgi:hypothetical protein
MNKLFEISIERLLKRKQILKMSEKIPNGGLENWLQWELMEALEDAGYKTALKGKVAQWGCDIIVDDEVGIELRTASVGNINWLTNAIDKHPKAHLYLFTFLNRDNSMAREIFERTITELGFIYKSDSLTSNTILLVAKRAQDSF